MKKSINNLSLLAKERLYLSMSEIKLFQINGQNAVELKSKAAGLEKSLQTLIGNNLVYCQH
jgi:hypothetical protein